MRSVRYPQTSHIVSVSPFLKKKFNVNSDATAVDEWQLRENYAVAGCIANLQYKDVVTRLLLSLEQVVIILLQGYKGNTVTDLPEIVLTRPTQAVSVASSLFSSTC